LPPFVFLKIQPYYTKLKPNLQRPKKVVKSKQEMKAEKHLDRALKIEEALKKLLPDEKGENVAAIVELTYGLIQHLLAYGCERKFGKHLNTHVGLANFLVTKDASEMAEIFRRLDEFRAGRWYGGQGNGEIVKKCLGFIKEVKKWNNLNG
jgi:hypothetical protein